jgi:hypothetical protein
MNHAYVVWVQHLVASPKTMRVCVTDWIDVPAVLTSEQVPELNCSVLPHAAERHEKIIRLHYEIIQ